MGTSPLLSEPLARMRAQHLLQAPRAKSLPLGLPLDARLPELGLPRGAVVELASHEGLGHATRIALAACASSQNEARAHAGVQAQGTWCAWIDTSRTLFAPGVASAGVALERLLVLRPAPDAMARVAVRLAASHLFGVIVVDRAGVPGAVAPEPPKRWSLVVRRLALALEGSESTVVLLSSLSQIRREPLPVAMRLELRRTARETLHVRVTKERHGRVGGPFAMSC